MAVEYFDLEKVEKVGAEPKELTEAWRENLRALKEAHPRVFEKVCAEVSLYTGEKDLEDGLFVLAQELRERHKKDKRISGTKIALTYRKYIKNHHGSLVKLNLNGTVTYSPRATIEGYSFVITGGEEVA